MNIVHQEEIAPRIIAMDLLGEMDSQMKDLQDRIKKYGIITPVIVSPRK